MTARVYLVTNQVNSKKYVGFTARSIKQRWKDHVYEANCGKSQMLLHRAIRKYGPENFKIQKLYSGTVENAVRMESVFIVKYKTFCSDGRGYNLTCGGEGMVGFKHSKESRERMSLAKKGKPSPLQGRKCSEESCKKNSLWHKGRKCSKKTREKMSRSAMGKPKPWLRGHKFSKEHCKKISLAKKGKPGHKQSQEARAKISLARRRLLA